MLQDNIHTASKELRSIDRTPLLALPSPEVREHPQRRRFSADYKRRILREIEAATQPGQVGAILRREGLYSSNIQRWRQQRERAEIESLNARKRGRTSTRAEALVAHNKELERKVRKLEKRLQHAELLLDIQKKISEITGIPLKDVEIGEDD